MSKSSKRRNCPAAGREISSAECGEGRQSRFACPADCPFNPFSAQNYSQYLEIEEAADNAMMERLHLDSSDPAALRREMSRFSSPRDILGRTSLIAWQCLYLTDEKGKTLLQRWQEQGFHGLKNDQRVALSWRMKAQVCLIEVHRVLSSEEVEVVDLLEPVPTPVLIHDRTFAGTATRFMVGLAWLHPSPHFHRIIGAFVGLVDVPSLEPRAVFEELCRHLGSPLDPPSWRRWLAENLPRVTEASSATSRARHLAMVDNIDANFGRAFYHLNAPFAEFCLTLRDQEDIIQEEVNDDESKQGYIAAWEVVDRSLGARTRLGMMRGSELRLGRIVVGSPGCKLEAMGAEGFEKLLARFESLARKSVRFVSKSVEDLRPRVSPAASPPVSGRRAARGSAACSTARSRSG